MISDPFVLIRYDTETNMQNLCNLSFSNRQSQDSRVGRSIFIFMVYFEILTPFYWVKAIWVQLPPIKKYTNARKWFQDAYLLHNFHIGKWWIFMRNICWSLSVPLHALYVCMFLDTYVNSMSWWDRSRG